MDYADICKKKGLDKDNKCAEDYCPMGKVAPTTCADCEEVLGQECVNRVSYTFEDISFSRTTFDGTYRYGKQLRLLATSLLFMFHFRIRSRK